MEKIPVSATLKCAAGTAARVYFTPPLGVTWKLEEVYLTPNEAVATNGTDYVSINAYKGSSTSLATARVTSSTGLTQGGVEALTLADEENSTNREITRTSPLSVRVAHSGSGKLVDSVVTAVVSVKRV